MIKVYLGNQGLHILCSYNERESIQVLNTKWNGLYKCFIADPTIEIYKSLLTLDNIYIEQKVHDKFKGKLGSNLKHREYIYKTEPRKHQKILTTKALEKEKYIFKCDMGTGKSKPALDTAMQLYKENKIKSVLIICPSSVVGAWQNEIDKHTVYSCTNLSGILNERIDKLYYNKELFCIINYDILSKKMDYHIIKHGFDMIIFDELHSLKSRTSARSKACYNIAKYTKYKLGLTGTMIANDYSDVFMQCKIIDSNIFGTSFTKFKDQYLLMGGFNAGYGPTKVLGLINGQQFYDKLSQISYEVKIDDVGELPLVENFIRKFTLDHTERAMYKLIQKESLITISDIKKALQKDYVVKNILEKIIRFSQCASGFVPQIEEFKVVKNKYYDLGTSKLKLLLEIIESISPNDKIIIWANFTHSIDRIADELTKRKITHYIFDSRQKDKAIYEKFNQDDTRIWLAQIKTGIGYSIPEASYSIFYEQNHSMVDYVQSKARDRRLNSIKKKCIYIHLQAENSIDEIIYDAVQSKIFRQDIV